jgi:CDP-glucose 4,6-dehydratase
LGAGPRAMEDVAMSEFWCGKPVLVTGHTGFKGSWLTLWLSERGARVTGYSLPPPTSPSNFVVSRIGERVDSIQGDVGDLERLKQCFTEHQPEVVFHLAAQSLVKQSYRTPVETYRTNVLGTVNVLEAVRGCSSTRAVIVVTSDKCYDNREWEWGYRENDPLGGHDPYSSSKGCAELVTAAYRNSYFNAAGYSRHRVALASARAGNVIGGGDWSADRLVPDILSAHESGKELLIRSPAAVRPWQFVLEPLWAYLTLAERLYTDGAKFADAWNFGPKDDDVLPVETVVKRLSALLKGGIRYRIAAEPSMHEATLLKLDCSKASARMGWRPKTSINDALRLVAEWHNAMLSGGDMQAVSLAQIRQFDAWEA